MNPAALRLLAAASTAQLAFATPAAAQAPAEAPQMAKVLVADCVFQDVISDQRQQGFFGTIVGILAPKLISAGFDAFGAALRKAGEKDVEPSIVSRAVEFPTRTGARCLHYVNGRFYQPNSAGVLPATDAGVLGGLRGLSDAQRIALASGVAGLAATPDIFIELRMHASSDGTAMLVAPVYVHYGRGLKAKAGQERGLAINLAFHGPGKAANDANATGGQIVLGKMKVGEYRRFAAFQAATGGFDLSTPWFPVSFGLSSATVAGGQGSSGNAPGGVSGNSAGGSGLSAGGAPSPDATNPGAGATATKAKPMNVTLTVTETRDPRKFLLFLAGIFDKSKAELQTEVEKLVLEQKREEAQLQAATTESTLVAAYEKAYVAARGDWLDMCAVAGQGSDAVKQRLQKWQSFNANAREANLKAQALGREAPFPNLTTPSPAPPAGCGAA